MEHLTEQHRVDAAEKLKTIIAKRGMEETGKLLGLSAATIERYRDTPFNMSVKAMHRINEVSQENGNGQQQETPKAKENPDAKEVPALTAPAPEQDGLDAQVDPVIKPIEGRDICVMEPFYREVHPKTHVAMKDWYNPSTMRTAWKDQESFLVRTRNRLAMMFLKSGCQWSLWLDHDIITPCRPDMYRALVDAKTAARVTEEFLTTPLPVRLMKWKKTIVSATYFDRHGHGSIMAVLRSKPNGKLPQNVLMPAVFSGMGCVLIHRKVFLDILEKQPELKPFTDGSGKEKEAGFFTPFQRPVNEGTKTGGGTAGEDEAFFKRAADAGHPCYVDLGAICGHVGECCYGLPDNL